MSAPEHDEIEPGAEPVELAQEPGAEPVPGETGDEPEGPQEPNEQPGDDEEEPEGPLSPEQQAKAEARAEKQAQQTIERLDKEAQRHRTRLSEILQEDVFRLVPCELCRADLAGFVDSTVAIPDEVKKRVRIQIGDKEPEDWQADTLSRKCDICKGLGEVLTGSLVHGQETLPCVPCGGKGWVPVGPERQGGVPRLAQVPPAASAPSNGAAEGPEPPEVAALRSQGYVVIKTAQPA